MELTKKIKLRTVEKLIAPPKPPLATDRNSKFVWRAGADVMSTFKRQGWIPPSEYRNDYLFKTNREMPDVK